MIASEQVSSGSNVIRQINISILNYELLNNDEINLLKT
jgi:hypothetical protein